MLRLPPLLLLLPLSVLLVHVGWAAASVAAPDAPAFVAALVAALRPNASEHVFTVLEIEQASVPAAARWFRVRPARPGGSMPTPIVPDGSAPGEQWFARDFVRGAQQLYPFAAAQMENSGDFDGVPPCELAPHQTHAYVVEAWSARTDLGDPRTGKLLASSVELAFTFDDGGFSRGLRFDHFVVTEHGPGRVTVIATPNNATLFAKAQEVTWFGMRPHHHSVPGSLPSFTLDTMLVGGHYSTRLLSPPRITAAFSQPGTYFLGIYGAWNGGYGYWFSDPMNGVRTFNSFPLDRATGTTFQPLAIRIPFENGTLPPLPLRFDGPVHVTPPIPGDRQLALRVAGASVFDGGSFYIHNVKGPPGFGVDLPGPRYVPAHL